MLVAGTLAPVVPCFIAGTFDALPGTKKFRVRHRLNLRSEQRFFLRTFQTTATAGHKLPRAWNFQFGISPLTKHSMGNQFTPLVVLTTSYGSENCESFCSKWGGTCATMRASLPSYLNSRT